MGCSELHFGAAGYGRGWINSLFMEFLLSTQHVKIADSNHLSFWFFLKEKVPVQVYVLFP